MISPQVSRYLDSRGVRGPWRVAGPERRDFLGAVVIPALAEKDFLFATLASLAANPAEFLGRFLILVVVNHRAGAEKADRADNEETLALLSAAGKIPGALQFAWIDAASRGLELPEKSGGVGLARKIGLDLALPLLDFSGPPPLLVSLDADTLVEAGYLPAVWRHFQQAKEGGAVIPFCHQRGKNPEQEAAIRRYELFLRCYVLGLERAGSPYAFHTVGSTMACRAEAYARMGGMNRREAAEDFYFLQHLAKTAGVRNLRGTVVFPSPRPSRRVPFGTGPSVARLLAGERGAVLFYRPQGYQILKDWLGLIAGNTEKEADALLREANRISPDLGSYLRQINFPATWEKLRKNFHEPALLRKGFHHWFDGLKTLKLIRRLAAGPYPPGDPDSLLPEFLNWANLNPAVGTEAQLALLRRVQT